MQDDNQPISIDSHGRPISSGAIPPRPEPPRKSKWRFIDHRERWQSLSTKHKIIVVLIALLVVVAAWFIAHSLAGGGSGSGIGISKKEKKSTTVASPLTGLQVAPDLAKRPVTGIMIENSPDARPQSGIQDAGVVFEAIAEGGITRFLTLYQEARPTYVGPVRSLRPYYIDWANGFDASVAHVGGSPDALSQIRNGGKDLDQFFNADSYWRESSRAAPHNVYTNFDKMDDLNKSKGYTSSNFTPWPRKADQKLQTPMAKSIDIAISGPTYDVHYDYDASSNSYHRSEGGASMVATSSAGDKSGTLLSPKVVVAMVMSYGIEDSSGHSSYGDIGDGKAYIFQDGFVVVGTWSKAQRGYMIDFKDGSGNVVKLNAGQVWLTAVQDGQVSYQ